MIARLAAQPDCGDDYARTLAHAAGELARGAGLDLAPADLLDMAAAVLSSRPGLMPPGVTLGKVIDRYLALRRDGLDHAAAVRSIRRAMPTLV